MGCGEMVRCVLLLRCTQRLLMQHNDSAVARVLSGKRFGQAICGGNGCVQRSLCRSDMLDNRRSAHPKHLT